MNALRGTSCHGDVAVRAAKVVQSKAEFWFQHCCAQFASVGSNASAIDARKQLLQIARCAGHTDM